jgi:hypothetical protein
MDDNGWYEDSLEDNCKIFCPSITFIDPIWMPV